MLQFNQSPLQIGWLYFGSSFPYLIIAIVVGPLTDKVVSAHIKVLSTSKVGRGNGSPTGTDVAQ